MNQSRAEMKTFLTISLMSWRKPALFYALLLYHSKVLKWDFIHPSQYKMNIIQSANIHFLPIKWIFFYKYPL